MMAAYYLTLINTSSEKGQLLSKHIKGPLVATIRSSLMKALDRSIETLGLWIVTSWLHLQNFLNQSSIKPCFDCPPGCLLNFNINFITLLAFSFFPFVTKTKLSAWDAMFSFLWMSDWLSLLHTLHNVFHWRLPMQLSNQIGSWL